LASAGAEEIILKNTKVLKDFQGGLGPTKQTMDRVSPAVYYTQLFEWGKNSLSGPAGGLKKKKQLFPGPSILFYFFNWSKRKDGN
jgi:hypothetical protein